MIVLALVFALATLAASANRAGPSLRAEYFDRIPRSFRGTVVVVIGAAREGATAEAGARAAQRVSHQFVDDATGQTFAVNWSSAASVIPRQSTHGTLIATFDGSVYTAANFESGAR